MTGYFADNSMAVRVMSNRAVGLTYGQRALVIGAAHPLLFHGTLASTSRPELPYSRLMRTARMFEAVFLGSKQDADKALAFTRRRHESVRGTLDVDAGPRYRSGTAYSADDPELMYLTMAYAFDSALTMQELLVRRLTHDEREELWQDFVRWAELFGMPRDAAPSSYPAFRQRFDAFQSSNALYLTESARLTGSYLVGAKRADYAAPPPLRPLFRSMQLVVMGSLPPRIRELYGFSWSAVQEVSFAAVVAATRLLYLREAMPTSVRRWVPDPMAPISHGTNGRLFMGIAQAERRHLENGLRSMPDMQRSVG